MRDMKSNILQRAEAAFYADEDEVYEPSGLGHGQKAGRDVAFEDEDGIDEGSVIHIRDGADSEEDEDSSDDDAGGDDGDAGESVSIYPYILIFLRDADTITANTEGP